MGKEELILSSNLLMVAHSKGRAPNIYNPGSFGLDSKVPEAEEGPCWPLRFQILSQRILEFGGAAEILVPETCSAQLDSGLVSVILPLKHILSGVSILHREGSKHVLCPSEFSLSEIT